MVAVISMLYMYGVIIFLFGPVSLSNRGCGFLEHGAKRCQTDEG